jgi:hypothetical protein
LDELRDSDPSSDGPLAASIREVEFPRRDLPEPSPLREQIYDAIAEAHKAVRSIRDVEDEERTAELSEAAMQNLADSRRMVEQLSEIAKGRGPIRSVVQVLRLGELAIVGIPGELFSRLGMDVKSQSPAEFTICAGYANDYIGYLSDTRAFSEGGYEVSLGPWCPVGVEGGAVATRAARQQLAELWA